MKKVALVFVLAVILPSLVLAWLAVRSLRDQQFLLEHQQALIDQHATDALAQNISAYLAQLQQQFSAQVDDIVGDKNARTVAPQFDSQIRRRWPLAEVGFCVTVSGTISCPSPNAGPEAQKFLMDNSDFLGNREAVEVYWNQELATANAANANSTWSSFSSSARGGVNSQSANGTLSGGQSRSPSNQSQQTLAPAPATVASGAALQKKDEFDNASGRQQSDTLKTATADVALDEPQAQNSANASNYKVVQAQARKVTPQQQIAGYSLAGKSKMVADDQNLSKAVPAEAEFGQLIGSQTDGMLARFLQNKLKLMFWHRLTSQPDMIFGAQLNLNRVVDDLRALVQPDPESQNQICIALLDDNARPVALSRAGFQANWKHPFVATEIGDALPHWEVAAYLVNPAALTRTACILNIILGLLIVVLVLAIVVGSWLIVRNLNYELTLARQKTDFVSNVSHELKTPLTSIRMFSELLAEQRVADVAKQRSYLQIITAEAARLTRLINNVLDFSRMERGEKKYSFQPCDLTDIVHSACETFRPHLEANGFKFDCDLPETKVPVRGDADALSQVVVNLLSNAEKYSNGGKEITVQVEQKQSPLPHAEIKVLDRGSGVPRGSEEKIFEKFYRAHDSLSSGIQGSGLGLTIARQIARAHGGDVVCEPRDGGGSCFVLRIPISGETT